MVSAIPRPSARTSATLRLRCRFCRCRETTVWLTASSSPAARTLPVRPTDSNARKAIREGNPDFIIIMVTLGTEYVRTMLPSHRDIPLSPSSLWGSENQPIPAF
ncbi:hypothetical protein BRAS3843_250003 [Bradyrhizobium sp. STM 3843]|nr:hypothetical protein BRAS3843_250003 [Bradyrhizobium sp. STM 3843]